jgi:hypothetical protein
VAGAAAASWTLNTQSEFEEPWHSIPLFGGHCFSAVVLPANVTFRAAGLQVIQIPRSASAAVNDVASVHAFKCDPAPAFRADTQLAEFFRTFVELRAGFANLPSLGLRFAFAPGGEQWKESTGRCYGSISHWKPPAVPLVRVAFGLTTGRGPYYFSSLKLQLDGQAVKV